MVLMQLLALLVLVVTVEGGNLMMFPGAGEGLTLIQYEPSVRSKAVGPDINNVQTTFDTQDGEWYCDRLHGTPMPAAFVNKNAFVFFYAGDAAAIANNAMGLMPYEVIFYTPTTNLAARIVLLRNLFLQGPAGGQAVAVDTFYKRSRQVSFALNNNNYYALSLVVKRAAQYTRYYCAFYRTDNTADHIYYQLSYAKLSICTRFNDWSDVDDNFAGGQYNRFCVSNPPIEFLGYTNSITSALVPVDEDDDTAILPQNSIAFNLIQGNCGGSVNAFF